MDAHAQDTQHETEPVSLDVDRERQRVLDAVLNREYRQQRLLDPGDFVRFAEERGVWVREAHLETWDRLGVLHPILRVHHPHFYRLVLERTPSGDSILDDDVLDREPEQGEDVEKVFGKFLYYRQIDFRELRNESPARLVIPTVENFQQWDTFHDGEHVTATPAYHPYQMLRLVEVAYAAQISCRIDEFALTDAEAAHQMDRYREQLRTRKENLHQSEAAWLRLLALLILIEDRYLPTLRQTASIKDAHGRKGDWHAWARTFRPEDALRESEMSVQEVQQARRDLAFDAENLDSYSRLYPLMRHLPYQHRQNTDGDARLAWDYYEAAEMLGEFLQDVTGEEQPHVDDLRMNSGALKARVFGVPWKGMSYREGNALPAITRHYGLDARTRIWVFAEGPTEIEFIEAWFRQAGIGWMVHAPAPLVKIVGFGGYAALNPKDTQVSSIRRLAEYVRDQDASLILMVDGDREPQTRRAVLEEWAAAGLIRDTMSVDDIRDAAKMPIGGLMWEPCFEDANFSIDELAQAWEKAFREEHPDQIIDEAVLRRLVDEARDEAERKTKVGALESKFKHNGRLVTPGRSEYSKPRVGRALAELFWDSDRDIVRLLWRVARIAEQRTARHRG